jgi:hypothetical protein
MGQKGKVIESIDQSGLSQAPGAVKIIGVNNIWVPQFGLKILGRMVPKELRCFNGPMAQSILKISPADSTGPRGPIGIPVSVSESRIKNIFIPQIDFGKVPDQTVGKVATSSFGFPGLADIKTNLHYKFRLN